MKFCALTILFLMFYSCSNESSVKTEIVKTEEKSIDSKSKESDTMLQLTETSTHKNSSGEKDKVSFGKMMLISSGQFARYETGKINGFTFDIVAKESDTTYIATRDFRFETPEGFRMGTKFSELPASIQNKLTKEPGWGYYYKLSSGWCLAFCEGTSCTDSYPKSESEVKWIFKRK